MNKTQKTVLVVVGLVLLMSYMMYLSMSPGQIACEVCIEFNGRTECRKAVGKDEEEAQRSATATACGLISGGVTDGIACGNTTPRKVACEQR
jgi:hypothetical protein